MEQVLYAQYLAHTPRLVRFSRDRMVLLCCTKYPILPDVAGIQTQRNIGEVGTAQHSAALQAVSMFVQIA